MGPFKDTSGPALNILIKMMSLIALVLAPQFKKDEGPDKGPLKAFDAKSWYIGVIILVVTFLFLAGFNVYSGKRYAALMAELNNDTDSGNKSSGTAAASEVEVEMTETNSKAIVAN